MKLRVQRGLREEMGETVDQDHNNLSACNDLRGWGGGTRGDIWASEGAVFTVVGHHHSVFLEKNYSPL